MCHPEGLKCYLVYFRMTIFQFLHCCFVEGKMSCYAHDEHLELEAQEVDSQVQFQFILNCIKVDKRNMGQCYKPLIYECL